MIINPKSTVTSPYLQPEPSSQQLKKAKNLFADCLENQIKNTSELKNEGKEIGSNQFSSDLEEIKEKGFSAYFRNLEKEKLEKIRSEILASMGLTEEDLTKLSSEQRAMIEEIIAKEIQTRLAASSISKKDDSNNKDQKPEKIIPGVRPDFVFVSMLEQQEKNVPISTIKKEEKG